MQNMGVNQVNPALGVAEKDKVALVCQKVHLVLLEPVECTRRMNDAIDRRARLDLSLRSSWSRPDPTYATNDLMRNARSATATTLAH
jgi:hypothetical protein